MARGNNWIQTYTGRMVWPTDPLPEDICIEDIAHALSLKCRFNGHCNQFYSVAQHCVLGSELVEREHKLWFLLHDAVEAYLPDVSGPIKAEMPGFDVIERRLMECIAVAFDLPMPEPHDAIRHADLVMLATEQRDVMSPPPKPWSFPTYISPVEWDRIRPWASIDSEARFLIKFDQLRRNR